jgi:hypothetical protein
MTDEIFTSRRRMKNNSLLHNVILVLGVFISAIMVIAFPELYHRGDVVAFMGWAARWARGWNALYESCQTCNYPLVGMAASAGLFKILWKIGISDAVWIFRLILAAVDGANVVLIYLLMRQLAIKDAAFWAGLAGLLASAWVGGAVWGQIDGVSQFFILLILLWIVICGKSSRISPPVYIGVSSLLSALLLLTKQLSIFSFFSLELLLLATIFLRRKGPAGFGWAALLLACQGVFLFIWDLFLELPEPYRSHLQLVWGPRSDPGGKLSMNGINIWVFLDGSMWGSAHDPLFPNSAGVLQSLLTPFNLGIFLFLVFVILITASLWFFVRRIRLKAAAGMDREIQLNFILHLALVNLGFNIWLTGTHERYLYHCFPFLLIACLGLMEYDRRFSKPLLVVILLGANLYGLFVFGVLQGRWAWNYSVHRVVTVYIIFMLGWLLFAAITYQAQRGRHRIADHPAPPSGV